MKRESESQEASSCCALARAWFCLTNGERGWLLVIVFLIVLGLSARYFYLVGERLEGCCPIESHAGQHQ